MPPSAQTSLASELRISVMRLARRLRQERTDSALSISQLSALATLDGRGPLTPSELAAHERIAPPSMTRLVASLQVAGMVSRTDHPTDRRQVLLAVSESGRELLRSDRRRRDAWLAPRLRALPAEELDTLRRAAAILERLSSS